MFGLRVRAHACGTVRVGRSLRGRAGLARGVRAGQAGPCVAVWARARARACARVRGLCGHVLIFGTCLVHFGCIFDSLLVTFWLFLAYFWATPARWRIFEPPPAPWHIFGAFFD